MRVWILVLAVSSLVVSSQACPPEHFSAAVVASIDQTVEDPQIFIEDPKLYFFKKSYVCRKKKFTVYLKML